MCLPQEIEWNIIKFMRHPVADSFLNDQDVDSTIDLIYDKAYCSHHSGDVFFVNKYFLLKTYLNEKPKFEPQIESDSDPEEIEAYNIAYDDWMTDDSESDVLETFTPNR